MEERRRIQARLGRRKGVVVGEFVLECGETTEKKKALEIDLLRLRNWETPETP